MPHPLHRPRWPYPSEDKMESTRSIERTIAALRTVEGGGFVVHRPFPTRLLMDFDPFLLLDEMGPVDYAPGEAKGAPDHPHRGFETVTRSEERRVGKECRSRWSP